MQYYEHNGKTCEILKTLNDGGNIDTADVGFMYLIKLSTGEIIESWPEELHKH